MFDAAVHNYILYKAFNKHLTIICIEMSKFKTYFSHCCFGETIQYKRA